MLVQEVFPFLAAFFPAEAGLPRSRSWGECPTPGRPLFFDRSNFVDIEMLCTGPALVRRLRPGSQSPESPYSWGIGIGPGSRRAVPAPALESREAKT